MRSRLYSITAERCVALTVSTALGPAERSNSLLAHRARDLVPHLLANSAALVEFGSRKGLALLQVGHSDYVVALAPVQPGQSTAVPGAGLVSGSRDTNVMVWDLGTGESVQTLAGHKYQVSAVGFLPSGEVVSAGLDGALKVWKGGKCVRTCEGHEGAILCLLVLPNGDILTGTPASWHACMRSMTMPA